MCKLEESASIIPVKRFDGFLFTSKKPLDKILWLANPQYGSNTVINFRRIKSIFETLLKTP
jgi:hypothetical protein